MYSTQFPMEHALLEFRDLEILICNTPRFFTDELQIEKIGEDTELEKVLNWWRTDTWIPVETRKDPKPDCAFCEVLKSPERVFDFYNFFAHDIVPPGYAIIINNKWVFPNHFLVITTQASPHAITPERIRLLSALAEQTPSFMLYITSRGLGMPQHFHGHLFKSENTPVLARANSRGQHFSGLWNNGTIDIAEIRYHPWRKLTDTRQSEYIAGWAVIGSDAEIVATVINVAQICTEVIAMKASSLQTDIFWGPQVNHDGARPVRTVFIFPRLAEGGQFRNRVGATEFVGLFAFNHGQYFWYSVEDAVNDLRSAGLCWEAPQRQIISNRIKEL